jgi:hypothetical protein
VGDVGFYNKYDGRHTVFSKDGGRGAREIGGEEVSISMRRIKEPFNNEMLQEEFGISKKMYGLRKAVLERELGRLEAEVRYVRGRESGYGDAAPGTSHAIIAESEEDLAIEEEPAVIEMRKLLAEYGIWTNNAPVDNTPINDIPAIKVKKALAAIRKFLERDLTIEENRRDYAEHQNRAIIDMFSELGFLLGTAQKSQIWGEQKSFISKVAFRVLGMRAPPTFSERIPAPPPVPVTPENLTAINTSHLEESVSLRQYEEAEVSPLGRNTTQVIVENITFIILRSGDDFTVRNATIKDGQLDKVAMNPFKLEVGTMYKVGRAPQEDPYEPDVELYRPDLRQNLSREQFMLDIVQDQETKEYTLTVIALSGTYETKVVAPKSTRIIKRIGDWKLRSALKKSAGKRQEELLALALPMVENYTPAEGGEDKHKLVEAFAALGVMNDTNDSRAPTLLGIFYRSLESAMSGQPERAEELGKVKVIIDRLKKEAEGPADDISGTADTSHAADFRIMTDKTERLHLCKAADNICEIIDKKNITKALVIDGSGRWAGELVKRMWDARGGSEGKIDWIQMDTPDIDARLAEIGEGSENAVIIDDRFQTGQRSMREARDKVIESLPKERVYSAALLVHRIPYEAVDNEDDPINQVGEYAWIKDHLIRGVENSNSRYPTWFNARHASAGALDMPSIDIERFLPRELDLMVEEWKLETPQPETPEKNLFYRDRFLDDTYLFRAIEDLPAGLREGGFNEGRRNDVFYLSHQYTDTAGFVGSYESGVKLDHAVLVFKGKVFNRELDKGRAAIANMGDKHYPFFVDPISIDDIEYIVISQATMDHLEEENLLNETIRRKIIIREARDHRLLVAGDLPKVFGPDFLMKTHKWKDTTEPSKIFPFMPAARDEKSTSHATSHVAIPVTDVANEKNVLFIHSVIRRNTTNSLPGLDIEWWKKLFYRVAFRPTIAVSTLAEGDGLYNMWGASGLILKGGDIEFAYWQDAGTVERGIRDIEYDQHYTYIQNTPLKDQIDQAINGRRKGKTPGAKNELRVGYPEFAGYYVCLDRPFRDTRYEVSHKEIKEYAVDRLHFPLFAVAEGNFYEARYDPSTEKIERYGEPISPRDILSGRFSQKAFSLSNGVIARLQEDVINYEGMFRKGETLVEARRIHEEFIASMDDATKPKHTSHVVELEPVKSPEEAEEYLTAVYKEAHGAMANVSEKDERRHVVIVDNEKVIHGSVNGELKGIMQDAEKWLAFEGYGSVEIERVKGKEGLKDYLEDRIGEATKDNTFIYYDKEVSKSSAKDIKEVAPGYLMANLVPGRDMSLLPVGGLAAMGLSALELREWLTTSKADGEAKRAYEGFYALFDAITMNSLDDYEKMDMKDLIEALQDGTFDIPLRPVEPRDTEREDRILRAEVNVLRVL